ncbi:Dolichyl-diphosphooligosaccharide--protein glycosyltransferase subunit KCP2 [Balamuthia mandrillaris]
MGKQPSHTTTAILSALLFVLTLSALSLWAPVLASTERLTIVGGFISSLLFFFALLTIGNLENETGWIEVFLCEAVALVAAATVHRVCVTTCFLFSVGLLYMTNKASQSINRQPVVVSKKGSSRK